METTEQNVAEVREMDNAKPAAKKTEATVAISKTDFVRNQPLGLSVASVIAMAKAQGITLSDSLVRKVRGPDGGKSKASAPKKVPGVKTAALKSKKPAKDVVKARRHEADGLNESHRRGIAALKLAPMSKSEYIRSLPVSMPVKKVIKKAKADGLTFSRALVHSVRGKLAGTTAPKKVPARKTASAPKRAKPKKPTPRKPASAPKKAPTVKPVTMSKSAFIRSVPASTSSKAAVVLGRAVGLKFDENFVAWICGKARVKGRKAAPKKATTSKTIARKKLASPKATAATTSAPTKAATMSKADFGARRQPRPVRQVRRGEGGVRGLRPVGELHIRVRRADKLAAKTRAAAKKLAARNPG